MPQHWPQPRAFRPVPALIFHRSEYQMAKGQKKSNKEVRKPKAEKSKTEAPTPLFSKGATTADKVPMGKR